MSQGQPLVPSPDAAPAEDSKLIEFTAFDRKVSVVRNDEPNHPSLYSLVRSWVLNGRPGLAERPADTSAPVVLPPSQPLPKEPLDYPPECFSKFYLGENNSGELKNLANVYKSAWVTAHTHYSHHKLRRRRRHAQRHNALLAVAQQTQKTRHASDTAAPTTSGPSAPLQSVAPSVPHSPTSEPASIAPPAPTSSHGQGNAPATSKQPHVDPSSWKGAALRQSGPQANSPQPLSSRSKAPSPHPHRQNPSSPGVFGTGFNMKDMSGGEGLRTAHNLADRSGPVRTASPHGSMHDMSGSASHIVAGPVNLADMQLRAAHQSHHQHPHQHQQQLAVSVAMDGPGVHAPQTSSGSAGAPAYNMNAMHTQHSAVNVGVSSVGSYGAGVATGDVSWEGRHSEQDTFDLQRQLQQLAEKESPVPIAIQPPMPIHAGARQALHGLSRREPAGSGGRGSMRAAAGESASNPPPGMSSRHGQPPVVPGSDQQHAERKAEPVQGALVAGAMGGNIGRQARGVPGTQSGGQQAVGHGEMLMDCKPARTTSALLDMADAFSLDEVMDISPVQ